MKILRSVLGVVVMVVSVLLIILFAAGIVGTWMANTALTITTVQVLTGVDAVLGRTEQALARLDTEVGDARARVGAFDESVAAAGENFAENPVILTALSERLDLGVGPAVEEVRGTVQTIRETALAAQNTVQTLNALPFVSIGGSVAEEGKLQAFSDSVTRLAAGVQEIRDGVREAKAGRSAAVVSTVNGGTSRLDAGLAGIETAVSGYGDKVSAMRARVAALQTALARWFDVASVVITLLLLWLIFAHGVTFAYGLSLLRRKD